MRVSRLLAAAAAFGLASVAHAAFTLNNGNATFTMPTAAGSLFPTSTTSPADFRPEGGATTDHVFYYNWGVRQPGFSNAGLTAGGASAVNESGNGTSTYTHTQTNAGGGASGQSRFDSVVTIQLTDGPGPGEARLDSTLVFTASAQNTGPNTYQLFHIVDVEFNGSAGNDQYLITDPGVVRGRITDSLLTVPAEAALFEGLGASRYEVGASAAVRSRLGPVGGLNNLSNTASFSGDGAYALQWEVTLAPGQSYTARSSLALVVPEPATLGVLALAVPALARRRKA